MASPVHNAAPGGREQSFTSPPGTALSDLASESVASRSEDLRATDMRVEVDRLHNMQVPADIMRKWQEIADLLADIVNVPSALIMRVEPSNIKVLVSSESKGNPYEPDELACLNTGLYCETVMNTRRPLIVPDALQDEAWKSNPDIKLGMISYLGVPISWPDGEIFGTICVLDRKSNGYSDLYLRLLLQWRDVLQADLRSIATTQREIEQREAKIRRLVDANIIGIVIWNDEGRILDANSEYLRIVGYDQHDLLSGRVSWADMTPAEWRDRDALMMSEVKNKGAVQPFEKEYIRKDGSRIPVLIGIATLEGTDSQGVAFVLDLTERRRAEAEARESERRFRSMQTELAHANRLATLGQLTASITHEVKQPITAALLNTQTAQRFLAREQPDVERAKKAIDRAVLNGMRVTEVVDRTHALVRKEPTRKDSLEINETISEVIGLTRGEVSKNSVQLRTQFAEGLPLIQGSRVQIQQVMLNLIVNAVEAMSQMSDEPRELLISTQAEADSILVAVRDSGPGLSEGAIDRAFEAFYTTKSSGLGMGLSICRSIVEDHGGRLWAAANVPTGAAFQFTLPIDSDAGTDHELRLPTSALPSTAVA